MFMRLGFSLAVHTDPDVLLVDEVLAVGDAAFVNKCKERIALLRKEQKTLLLVTHDLDAVERWCDECLWIEKGQVRDRGNPRRVIDAYRSYVEKGEEEEIVAHEQQQRKIHQFSAELSDERDQELDQVEGGQPQQDAGEHRDREYRGSERPAPERWGSREIELTKIELSDANLNSKRVFHPDEGVIITVHYQVHEEVTDVVFGLGIHRSDGVPIYGTNTNIERIDLPTLGQQGKLTLSIAKLTLLDGRYTLDLAVHRKDGYPFDYHSKAIEFAVRCTTGEIGVFRPALEWEVQAEE